MTKQQSGEVPVFVPAGFPDYLAFRPEADTVELNVAIVQELTKLERKLQTSNHVTPQQLGTQHLQPLFVLLHQWMQAAMRDQLVHTHHLAEFIADDHPDFLDEEDIEKFDQFFVAVQTLTGLVKPFLAGGVDGIAAEAEKLGEEGLTSLLALANSKAKFIQENLEPLADIVASFAAPVEEEEEEEEEEGAAAGEPSTEDGDEDSDESEGLF